jgi:hypothetical protein
MPSALNVHVQVKDDTLVLTDRAGKTLTFSKEQTVPQQVRMMALGALCGLPKRHRATGFGCKTRTAYDDSRNAVLIGAPQDLVPKRTGSHTRAQRTKEVEALIIRTRCETEGKMAEMAEAFTALGFPVSARLVGRVLADDGLSTKTGGHRRHPLPGSLPKRRSQSLTAPASRAPASSLATTARMTSPPSSNTG